MVHALVEAEKEAGLTLLTEMKFNLDLYNQVTMLYTIDTVYCQLIKLGLFELFG